MRMRVRPALTALAAAAMVAALAAPALAAQASTAPAVTVTPGTGEPTVRVTVHGSHFRPGSAIAVVLGGTKLGTITPGPAGGFSAAVMIPRGTVSGTHVLTARQATSGDRATTKLVVRVNWPQPQFNVRRTGYNYLETVIGRPNAAALTEIQSATPEHASDIVLDNGLVLTQTGTRLQALNAATLATAWTDTDDSSYSGIAASNGVVYAAVESGILGAYNEATGAREWEYDSPSPASFGPPLIADGVAYVDFGYDLTAIDLDTHQALWNDEVPTVVNLALDGGTLYTAAARLTALDAATGATTWSTRITPAGADGGTPAIDAAGNLYVGTNKGVMDAYTPAGTRLWSVTLNVLAAFDPAVAGTTLYTIATGDNNDELMALNTSDGSQLWETPLDPGTSSPTVANGVVYAGVNDGNSGGTGTLNAYNSATGAALASYPLNDQVGPPTIIANGTIYQGDDGVTELTPSPLTPAIAPRSLVHSAGPRDDRGARCELKEIPLCGGDGARS